LAALAAKTILMLKTSSNINNFDFYILKGLQPMRRIFISCLSVFAVLTLSLSAAYAADDKKAWDVRCKTNEENGKEYCEMFQMITVKKTNQRFVEIAFFKDTNGKMGGVIILPLGLLVAKPIILTVDDGKKMAFTFHTCTPGGCLARISATDELMTMMRKGEKVSLSTHSQLGKPFNVKLSLAGFSKAHKELMKK
jgi:invasion protein IalB